MKTWKLCFCSHSRFFVKLSRFSNVSLDQQLAEFFRRLFFASLKLENIRSDNYENFRIFLMTTTHTWVHWAYYGLHASIQINFKSYWKLNIHIIYLPTHSVRIFQDKDKDHLVYFSHKKIISFWYKTFFFWTWIFHVITMFLRFVPLKMQLQIWTLRYVWNGA